MTNYFSRREFVKFIGGQTALISLSSSCALAKYKSPPIIPIKSNFEDKLLLSQGLKGQVLISWKDLINTHGDRFGFNNDFTAFIPLEKTNDHALLWVNHEYINPLFVSNHKKGQIKTKNQVDPEMYNCGGSILHLQRNGKTGLWNIKTNSKYAKRITAQTPIPIISPSSIKGSKTAMGTICNCAGGTTPWGTILTCEENFDLFYGDGTSKGNYQWERFYNNPPEHYGWVVEVNPISGNAKKLTALGRFSHESATTRKHKTAKSWFIAVMIKKNEHLYKFISKTSQSLEEGDLYVADTINGKWLSLDIEKNTKLKNQFKSQLDVLIHTRSAAKLVGATPLDRPEDIEINPKTGDVFVCLSNNRSKDNYHGSILKIKEKNNDPLSLEFSASNFLVGGSSFSCPDNIVFDKNGNLWLANDISGSKIGKEPYEKFGNNGLYFIPMSGPQTGKPLKVVSAPTQSEITGLSFSSDYKTLFCSIQHPGEKSKSLDRLTSNWPDGGDHIPRPSVIQINGPLLEKLAGA